MGVQPSAKTMCCVSRSGRRNNPARSAVRMEAMFSALVRAMIGHGGRCFRAKITAVRASSVADPWPHALGVNR
jgi:hypothetical protein